MIAEQNSKVLQAPDVELQSPDVELQSPDVELQSPETKIQVEVLKRQEGQGVENKVDEWKNLQILSICLGLVFATAFCVGAFVINSTEVAISSIVLAICTAIGIHYVTKSDLKAQVNWTYLHTIASCGALWACGFSLLYIIMGIEGTLKFRYGATDEQLNATKACAKGFFPGHERCADEEVYVWPSGAYLNYPISLYIHLIGSIFCLPIGLIQLFKPFRIKHVQTHRVMGRIYVLAVWTSSIGVFCLLSTSLMSTISVGAFFFGNIYWIGSLFKALYHIYKKEIQMHRKWMIRHYVITFGAVSIAILFWFFALIGLQGVLKRQLAICLTWTLSMFVGEIHIRRNIDTK